ncbi:MAG: GAF domain-containing protein [Bacteroidetes bacterium]|nr:MAG: GAF domain-containing protein [Bacteroidota bacterium]
MIRDFVSSIKGKITIVIFFLIVLIIFFSAFVLYQNNMIEKKTKMLNLHAEPTITLTFITVFSLVDARNQIFQRVIFLDTIRQDFSKAILESKNTLKSIKAHCDTLEIFENIEQYKNTLDLINKYEQNGHEIIDIIADYRYKNKYTDFEVDTILKSRLQKLESNGYWAAYGSLFEYFGTFSNKKETLMSELITLTNRTVWVILFLAIFIIILSVLMWNSIFKYVTSSIEYIINHLKRVSSGELLIEKTEKKDEVAQILTATNRLVSNLSYASDFAISVGKGEFKTNFKPSSEKDILGQSLIAMRDELWKFKTEDEKRFWANKGLAKFADIMRENNQNVSGLSDVFLCELVKYLGANQGSIYFAQKNNSENVQLEMIACYAYEKKKHVESILLEGEGIIGQAYKEKDTIYLKEIPENYIKITSGLGESLPTTLLVVPIKIEKDVLGILELASFDDFEKYQIDFTENICTNLASVLQSVSNSEKMSHLLDELKIKSEQMHSQEEELRQNMEELIATQEELQRKDAEREKLIKELKTEIENLKSNQ